MASHPSADITRPRLAFLTPSNPIDADSGGKQFTLDRLLGLATLADVDVFCLEDAPEQLRRLSELLGGRPVHAAGQLKPRTMRHWAESMLRGMPLSVWRNNIAELRALVDRHAGTTYDVVYVDHWLMWPASKGFNPAARRLLNLHNAEHLIFQRAAEAHQGALKYLLSLEAKRVRRYVRRIGVQADAVHSISEADRQELIATGIPASNITAILPCVNAGTASSGRPGGHVLFAGTLTWIPNVEGLDWFLREVLPNLDIAQTVQVVGGPPVPAWLQLPSAAKVEFLGRVPSVEPLYAEAGVMIAPVFSGSGIKIKIVNSLARGLPVVTTSCGIEGFPPGWEGAVRVSDDPAGFRQAVRELINDTTGWATASSQAKQYAARHFSTEAARSKLEECLNVSVRS
ncbi:glycosyltransferase family 4 protein [Roseateles sp. LKC17W]|uniref:Glycosyltransferase family 4 protein n=1 Tax=Pelomonas margarita TaxID=3299031 RepID=A0ABW7FK31_9BURK